MRYGFIVLPEERLLSFSTNFDEGEKGTIFVEVETDVPRYPENIKAEFYYGRNFAKWNLTTEKELKERFPKSFSKSDSGEEYTKLCNKGFTALTQ